MALPVALEHGPNRAKSNGHHRALPGGVAQVKPTSEGTPITRIEAAEGRLVLGTADGQLISYARCGSGPEDWELESRLEVPAFTDPPANYLSRYRLHIEPLSYLSIPARHWRLSSSQSTGANSPVRIIIMSRMGACMQPIRPFDIFPL